MSQNPSDRECVCYRDLDNPASEYAIARQDPQAAPPPHSGEWSVSKYLLTVVEGEIFKALGIWSSDRKDNRSVDDVIRDVFTAVRASTVAAPPPGMTPLGSPVPTPIDADWSSEGGGAPSQPSEEAIEAFIAVVGIHQRRNQASYHMPDYVIRDALKAAFAAAGLRSGPADDDDLDWHAQEARERVERVMAYAAQFIPGEAVPVVRRHVHWLLDAALRGGPAPSQPSEEAKRAAFVAMYERKPEVSSGGGAMLWSDQLRWRMLTAGLSAAYAIDGLRAVPSQESGPSGDPRSEGGYLVRSRGASGRGDPQKEG